MSDTSPTAYDLFALTWITLADLLGTAATATVLRRAARRATVEAPELQELVIKREGLEYTYDVPESWRQAQHNQSLAALRALMDDLGPLLVDLTGSIVVSRLEQLVPLREQGVLSPEEVAKWLRSESPRQP
jgi:hypothetical protein